MTDGQRIQLDFNTAITGIDAETGAWNEKVHDMAVMPLRALLMQIDGVYGCHIGRYAMQIQYYPNVTSKEEVIAAAEKAVEEVSAKDGFFPIKGEKTPVVQVEPAHSSTVTTWWVARVDFDTDLYINKNKKFEASVVNPLGARLAKADGARENGVWQRGMYVQFDQRQTTPESMEAHLKNMVKKIMKNRVKKGYFPFAEPNFTYKVGPTNYVI